MTKSEIYLATLGKNQAVEEEEADVCVYVCIVITTCDEALLSLSLKTN